VTDEVKGGRASQATEGLPRLDGVRLPRRFVLHRFRFAGDWFIRRRWEVHLHGTEHVPKQGPIIFAPNHPGWMDGPVLAILSPRPVHALTKKEMFTGAMGVFLRAVGQIELDRFNVDPGAVKACLQVLRHEGAVGIFPEGSRGSGDLDSIRRGAAYLALVTGAPVVPVVFFGTREPGGSSSSIPRKGSRFDVVYGEPVSLPRQPWPRTRDDVLRTTILLAGHLREHLEAAKALTGRTLPGPLADPEEEL
jgi:1-acyl-sn-glycerol-3-phosphate acyltransferase